MLSCVSQGPPEPVKITTPVSAQTVIPDKGFLIEIRGDNSVWYKDRSGSDSTIKKVDEPVTQHLITAIAAYRLAHKDEKYPFLIKGDVNSGYKTFREVVEALKACGEYKYNLVTSPDDASTTQPVTGSENLPQPKGPGSSELKDTDFKNSLTLIILADNKIYGYVGDDISNGAPATYEAAGELMATMYKVSSDAHNNDFAVFIKQSKSATNKNMVDILDKIREKKIPKFAITDVTQEEKQFIEKHKAQL